MSTILQGTDAEPSNDVHDYVFKPSSRLEADTTTPKTFQLVVAPGSTDADSSQAVGTSISTTTAGSIGTFLITAHDAFGNRRPGGDSVTALMRNWNEVEILKTQRSSKTAMTNNYDIDV